MAGHHHAAACCVIAGLLVAGCTATNLRPGANWPAGSAVRAARQVCGRQILNSPYHYDGAAGSYSSGAAGLPTYGAPGTDFPADKAGVVLPAGVHSYPAYELRPHTVYYLLPGVHIGSLMADTDDAFVGGFSHGVPAVLSGDYSGLHWAIDSDSSDQDQPGVTIEYLTIEKYQPDGNAGAVNQDSNTGWMVQYNTITLNAPGAGVVLGADNVLRDNCLTLNGQYGFTAIRTDSWGADPLTGGPYNITVEDNEISYNDTCDFEGLVNNPAIGWSRHNPVRARYRNPECRTVVPDGDEGGFKLWQTDGVSISSNYIHDNWGPGGWADTDNANTTFSGNTISSNDGPAIIEEISYNFAITGNYLADNGWVAGLGNPEAPAPAIYVSESGSDATYGGVPGCPKELCPDQGSYPARSLIRGNTIIDNSGNVLLWQSSDRYCSDGFDSACTLVDGGQSGPYTISGCKANLAKAAWWNGCLWKTENVSITHNVIDFNPAAIPYCNHGDWPACGGGGILSLYGSPPGSKPGWIIPTQLTFFQHDSWSDNTYNGPSTFYAWSQGNGDNPVSWTAWTASVAHGDKCGSPGERSSGYCTGPFGQDAGSTYRSGPLTRLPVTRRAAGRSR